MLKSFNTFLRKAYNLSNLGGQMTARRSVLLIIVFVFIATSCGDGGPGLLNPGNDWLVKFKRVTLATDSPDRLEIEIVVRTGPNFSEPAPDGTKVAVETSISEFEGNGPILETSTIGGHAVVRLVLHSTAAHTVVTARVEDVEVRLSVVVDEHGSMRLVS
jgi:hypothetical protein